MPLDSETRASCTLHKMEPACMAEPSWGSIPGKTQPPREFTRAAGHQKMLPNLAMVALPWIAIHVQGHWGNFANRRVSTYIWLELIFHGCLHFRNRLKQQLITETLRLCFRNIWFPQLFTISNMQLVFALLYSPLIFSYRKAWQQLFFTLPISHFWAPRLMPKKFSRGVDRLMAYTIWYTVHGLTNTKCTRYLKIHKKFIKLGTPTLKIQRRIKSQSISYLFC